MGFGKGKGFSPVVPPPVVPEPGVQSNDCQLLYPDGGHLCQAWNAGSQTFTPDHDYIATRLNLLLHQYDLKRKGPLIVKIELPATNCWEAEVLWSQELYSTDLPPPGDYRWMNFVLPNLPLTKDNVYRITVYTLPGWYYWIAGAWVLTEAQAAITWRAKGAGNPYPRGYFWIGCNYLEEAGPWDRWLDSDFAFCIQESEAEKDPPIDKEVEAGTDDCWTLNDYIGLTTGYLYLDHTAEYLRSYARFLSIPLLNKITITKAYIDLKSVANYTGSSSFRILGIKQANTATFSTQADADARPVTDAYVDWAAGNWATGEWYGRTNEPQDIKAIIQEIVNQAGWDVGNALAIKIINNTPGIVRQSLCFEGDAPPRLYIEYSTPD